MLKNTENKSQWATTIRQTQSIEEQARIFYESFVVLLSKEAKCKADLRAVMDQVEQKARQTKIFKDDYDKVKKQYTELKAKHWNLKSDLAKAN